MLANVNRLLCR